MFYPTLGAAEEAKDELFILLVNDTFKAPASFQQVAVEVAGDASQLSAA